MWLPCKAKIGILTSCECVETSDRYAVKFQRISTTHKEVTVRQKGTDKPDNDMQAVFERLHLGGTTDQQAELKALLFKYADVFAVQDEDLGYIDHVQHEIPLLEETPVNHPFDRFHQISTKR